MIWKLLISMKMLIWCALAGGGILILFWRKTNRVWRLSMQVISFLLLGGVIGLLIHSLQEPLGMHPSPICAFSRLLENYWLQGNFFFPLFIVLIVILGLSLIGRKLFCGWVCPLGGLQEAVYRVWTSRKSPNLPFRFTNSVRIYFFFAFLVGLLFFKINIYPSLNLFELLHWEMGYVPAVAGIGLLVLVSFFYYRPYCYFLCPIGLITWVLERVSLCSIRLDHNLCTNCRICLTQVPCPSLESMINQKHIIPDCTSCGDCLKKCPAGALSFGLPQPKK